MAGMSAGHAGVNVATVAGQRATLGYNAAARGQAIHVQLERTSLPTKYGLVLVRAGPRLARAGRVAVSGIGWAP